MLQCESHVGGEYVWAVEWDRDVLSTALEDVVAASDTRLFPLPTEHECIVDIYRQHIPTTERHREPLGTPSEHMMAAADSV